MTPNHFLAVTSCFAMACCSPAQEPAPPPQPPVARPSPAPSPVQAPVQALAPIAENWMDEARTEGDWRYGNGSSRSYAAYGEPGTTAIFVIGCDKASRQVHLLRPGTAQNRVPMRILSETGDRLLTAQAANGSRPMIRVSLNASDPLLDAMAFSKGRFTVELPGLDTLYLPSWTEISRVVEDCR